MSRRIYKLIVVSMICSTWTASRSSNAMADSLFWRSRAKNTYLVEDSRARRPGDLLTVIINESTEMQNRENRALNKSSGASGTFDLAGSTATNAVSANLDGSKQTARNFSGDATYRNSREVLDRITVSVISTHPENGNLFICGEREMTISGDKRILKIEGVVRMVDIGPDNTVSSRFIGNMRTSYETAKGPEKHFTRQGFGGRFMNSIWPF